MFELKWREDVWLTARFTNRANAQKFQRFLQTDPDVTEIGEIVEVPIEADLVHLCEGWPDDRSFIHQECLQ
jgi:hypothetical protein